MERYEASIQRGTAEHPVLGSYSYRFMKEDTSGEGRWHCEYQSTALGYSFALSGDWREPSPAQIERLQEMEQRIAKIIAAIPPPPEDDGWGQSFTHFKTSVAFINCVGIRADLSLEILMDYEPDPGQSYYLSPLVKITPDWQITARWTS